MNEKQIHSKNWLLQSIFNVMSILRRSIIKEDHPKFWIYELLVQQPLAEWAHGNRKRALAMFRYRYTLFTNHKFNKDDQYLDWIWTHEPQPTDLEQQTADAKAFSQQPLISIVTPVYRPPRAIMEYMLASVAQQSYEKWEHCIVNADPADRAADHKMRAHARKDSRVIVKTLDQNHGIAENTNAAIKMAHGEWIAFLDHDDQLAPFALYEIVKLINEHPEVDVIYSDEDKIRTSDQMRFSPFFKPDFNLDYLRSLNYMTHFLVVRKSLGDSIGWLDKEYDGSQDYDLVLKLAEKTGNIYHIPRLLYHWKAAEGSAAGSSTAKTYAVGAGERALVAHICRSGSEGTVVPGEFPYQVRYTIPGQPKISMLIPNRDNSATLKRLLDSVFEKSTYPNYEIIIVENGSKDPATFSYYQSLEKDPRVKIVKWNAEFNYSLVNNFGEEHATGEVILLLNNDLEVITPDWLERMLEQAVRPEIGAVGAKLYYPNDTVQHGGVVVGLFGAAGHSHKYFERDSQGYYNRLVCVQNYSAVTAACLMIRREVYKEVAGLDPAFKIEFGDVDFCLRILSRGYRNLWTPYAELYHHESLTRGGTYDTPEKQQLNHKEVALFQSRWKDFLQRGDPSYNPNLTHQNERFNYYKS